MLAPAHVGHLAMLRSLIRQAAAEGSFESSLAQGTPQAAEFFAKLKRALTHGYFAEADPKTGRIESVAVPGYVFWPDDRHSGNTPVGFGLFRAVDGGYEYILRAPFCRLRARERPGKLDRHGSAWLDGRDDRVG